MRWLGRKLAIVAPLALGVWALYYLEDGAGVLIIGLALMINSVLATVGVALFQEKMDQEEYWREAAERQRCEKVERERENQKPEDGK